MTLTPDWNISNPVTYARMRQTMLDGALQEGVVGANDLKVAQRGAGANQSVDVPAGAAWVQIDTGTRNGLGHVYNDATANVTVTASNGTNPRIDQIILRWNDSSIPTGSGNVPTLEVLTGTATSGATLDNRTGAAALPNDCLRLADLLIPTSSTSVTTANIRDRRPWARGAFTRVIRTTADYSTASTSAIEIDATNLAQRIECSGALLRVSLTGNASQSIAGARVGIRFWQDGTTIDGAGIALHPGASIIPPNTTFNIGFRAEWLTSPTAGSHVFSPAYFVSSGTGTIGASSSFPLLYVIEEIVRPNANNT